MAGTKQSVCFCENSLFFCCWENLIVQPMKRLQVSEVIPYTVHTINLKPTFWRNLGGCYGKAPFTRQYLGSRQGLIPPEPSNGGGKISRLPKPPALPSQETTLWDRHTSRTASSMISETYQANCGRRGRSIWSYLVVETKKFLLLMEEILPASC